MGGDGLGQRVGVGIVTAARAVGADKIGVAERASGKGAVRFAPRPQVAAGETAKNGGASGLRALALEGIKNFLDVVARHGRGITLPRLLPRCSRPVPGAAFRGFVPRFGSRCRCVP